MWVSDPDVNAKLSSLAMQKNTIGVILKSPKKRLRRASGCQRSLSRLSRSARNSLPKKSQSKDRSSQRRRRQGAHPSKLYLERHNRPESSPLRTQSLMLLTRSTMLHRLTMRALTSLETRQPLSTKGAERLKASDLSLTMTIKNLRGLREEGSPRGKEKVR